MALEIADRVKETTTTTSTGTYALAGAVDGFQSFAAVGNGNTTYYACTDGTDYEVGIGSYTASGTTLTRVTILESSNSDAAVNWGAGTKEIFVTVPAEKYLVRDASGNVSLTGNLTISGTVDGRDVSADGSKLDGIESGATADQTAAQIRAKVEAASDSNVFTDADHSKLNGIEANAKNDQTITAGGGLTGGGTGDVTISHSDTSSQASVNGSGRTYIQDITLDTYGHVTGLATATETVVNTDTNTIPNNATITLSAGGALTGGGNFTTDQSSNETITFNHADTSSQASVNNSGRTYIQDITLDAYGHITGISSATETVVNTDTNTTNFNVQANGGTQVNISAGEEVNFINGNATTAAVTNQANPTVTFHHNDTSSQASVNNSGGTVIQDVTLDGYGHVTGLTSYNLDGRYFTETESDSRFVRKGVGYTWTAVGGNALSFRSNDTIDTASGDQAALEIYQDNAGHDAFIQFHVAGDYGKYLGLHGGVNDFVVGGWSHGASYQRLFHDGYHPNADKWTSSRTLSLTGDVTGSVSWDGSGNASLSTTVANDSHSHSNYLTSNADDNLTAAIIVPTANRDEGIFGTYDSTKTQHIWSMGTAYRNAANGSNFGNLYGLAYKHTNNATGGTMASGHQMVWCQNGSPKAALGTNIWTSGSIIVGGTVDGRDVAADGTKLDTIATNANNYSFPYTVSASASNSTVVQRHSSGYIYANYFNTTPNDVSSGVTKICCETGNDGFIRHATADAVRSFINVANGANNYSLPAGPNYIDVATGNYGTVKVDDDRGVTWGGYAIRDDWVFMANGADQSGIYNDTDNEWAITFHRNADTRLYHNGSESLRTIGINGIRVGSPSSGSSDIYMSDTNEGERRIHCNSNRIGFLNSSNGWGSYCEDAGHWVVAGNITASGNVNSQSDVRVKENIEPISDAMQKVQSINGVTFNRNDLDDTETRYVGVIAQDVEAVLPEAVSENGEGIKQVAYGNMVGLLIEAIKEQQTQIDDLKAEIQSMKS